MKMKATGEEARHEWTWKTECWSKIPGGLLIMPEHQTRCVLMYAVDRIRGERNEHSNTYGARSGLVKAIGNYSRA